MSVKKKIIFTYIKLQRYIFKRKFIAVIDGPLKGYMWSTMYNYEYLTGEYEDKEALSIFSSWLGDNSVFYDLGANVGYYSFIANLYIREGKIYSFEPLPANIDTFNKHLQLNDKKLLNSNITLLPYAVSDKEQEVVFSNNQEAKEGNTYIKSKLHTEPSDNLIVKCFSVDGLLAQGYKKPDVIKIDVEGSEFDVLKGAENTLIKYKPKILLATHDCHFPGVQKQCVDFLKGLGYDLKLLNSNNKIMSGLDDYIAIHKDNC